MFAEAFAHELAELALVRPFASNQEIQEQTRKASRAYTCSLLKHKEYTVITEESQTCILHYNCRASHNGDAWRGRGRERERGISSELARVVVVVILVVVVAVIVVVVVVVVVVFVFVVVVVVVAVAAWSSCRCRCYLCSWYFLQTPENRQIGGSCRPPKSVK